MKYAGVRIEIQNCKGFKRNFNKDSAILLRLRLIFYVGILDVKILVPY